MAVHMLMRGGHFKHGRGESVAFDGDWLETDVVDRQPGTIDSSDAPASINADNSMSPAMPPTQSGRARMSFGRQDSRRAARGSETVINVGHQHALGQLASMAFSAV